MYRELKNTHHFKEALRIAAQDSEANMGDLRVSQAYRRSVDSLEYVLALLNGANDTTREKLTAEIDSLIASVDVSQLIENNYSHCCEGIVKQIYKILNDHFFIEQGHSR